MNEDYGALALSELLRQEREQSQKYEDALKTIIDRSHLEPWGTSKVQDMRKIAEEALKRAAEITGEGLNNANSMD